MRQETEQAERMWETKKMTHERKDYRNAPGCKLLGIRNARPVVDHRNRELMIMGIDATGQRVMISREEALMEFWFPTPEEIEARKRECEFLFPSSHQDRVKRATPDPWTVTEVTEADRDASNRYGASDY